MNIKRNIFILLLVIIPALGFSQRWKLSRSEYSYGIGFSNYFGDIGGSKNSDAFAVADLDFSYTRPALSVGYRYKLYERVSLKADFTYANIRGSDVKSANEGRNYSFTSNLFELNGHLEYHITEEKTAVTYKSMSLRGKLKKFNAGINIYVFMGVGGAYFKPKAQDSFEGSDRFNPNKNLALVVPVGLGFKYPLNTQTYVGLEIAGRYTTSDFIDGFSSESSNSKDIYYITVISVSYKIKKKANKRPDYRF